MSDSHQDLASEFPKYKDLIHELKTTDAHFSRLFERYHVVTKEIHRAAERIAPTTELHEEELRKERLKLKDELYAILTATEHAKQA